jgi:hypothetical protein
VQKENRHSIVNNIKFFTQLFKFDKISNERCCLAGHGDRGGLTDLHRLKNLALID